jgi:replicative DNA helicase
MTDIPPHSLEAEQATLGCVMIDRSMWDVVAPLLKPSDFYSPSHEKLWLVMCKLADAGAPLDKITVAEEMRKDPKFGAEGIAYLTSLMDVVPTSTTAEYYARIVADKAASRRLAAVGRQLHEAAMTERFVDSTALADWATQQVLGGAGVRKSIEGHEHIEVLRGVRYAIDHPRTSKPFMTPWPSLDRLTGGFKPGELVLWAAAPGMGKSITQINLAHYNAVKYGASHGKVLFFALEMGEAATSERILSMVSGVPVGKFRMADSLTVTERTFLDRAQAHLEPLPIQFFDRSPRMTLHEIKLAARLAATRTGVSAIHIDHIGFIGDLVDAGVKGNKHAVLDSVLMDLVSLSAELKCAMHVVFHMNRAAADKKPSMFHLRDGGNAEGHATTIIFPWRANPDNDPDKKDDSGDVIPPTRAALIVGKVRDGKTGSVQMEFVGEHLTWYEALDGRRSWFAREVQEEHRRAAEADGADPETGEVRMPFKDAL